MPFWIQMILTYAGCYLVGGIPFGYFAGLTRGIDIRTVGSGNTGATNVGRLMGGRWAFVVFLCDALKGFVPTLMVGFQLADHASEFAISGAVVQIAWLGAGLSCILGHSLPVYLRFRGGKGVATSLGVILGIYPYMSLAGVMALLVWGVVLLLTRVVSLASMVAAIALPVAVTVCMFWHGYAEVAANLPMIAFAILVAALVLYRHRANITRLRAGQEARIGEHSERANST